jgi:hypothetical protein
VGCAQPSAARLPGDRPHYGRRLGGVQPGRHNPGHRRGRLGAAMEYPAAGRTSINSLQVRRAIPHTRSLAKPCPGWPQIPPPLPIELGPPRQEMSGLPFIAGPSQGAQAAPFPRPSTARRSWPLNGPEVQPLIDHLCGIAQGARRHPHQMRQVSCGDDCCRLRSGSLVQTWCDALGYLSPSTTKPLHTDTHEAA